MNELWKNIIITEIRVAVHVAPNTGKHIHKKRPYHGLVLNDSGSVKDYVFDDGRIMRTDENALFYLPKGSSYHVESHQIGGCYAINFDAEIDDEPFCVKLKNYDSIKRSFRTACDEWRSNALSRNVAAMRALYNGIYLLQSEQKQGYIPSERSNLILPALDAIERDFTDPNLTVASLSSMCQMSEVYFRKIFLLGFGISPKEYLIGKRMEYAKQLLMLGEFEVSKIAELCGYSEPCHFSREFKKRFGVSPKNYS